MVDSYSPATWFWVVGNKSAPNNIFSAPAAAYVASSDAGYQAFVSRGNHATQILCDGELAHVLWLRGNIALARAAGVTSLGGLAGMPAADAVELLAAIGVAVTFSTTGAFSGTYGTDPVARQLLPALLANWSAFPGTGNTYPYPDVTGTAHAMTQAQAQGLYGALAGRYAALLAWQPLFAANPATAMPAMTATVAL